MKPYQWLLLCCIGTASLPSGAATYVYPAVCEESTSKQGEQSDDLSTQAGKKVTCDSVILSFTDNGHVLVQFANKSESITPLGFGGDRIDYDSNPNFLTVPITRIYLPHASRPGTPQVVNGVEGFCFIDGKINIRQLTSLSCAVKMEIGSQKLLYKVITNINGIGTKIPGM